MTSQQEEKGNETTKAEPNEANNDVDQDHFEWDETTANDIDCEWFDQFHTFCQTLNNTPNQQKVENEDDIFAVHDLSKFHATHAMWPRGKPGWKLINRVFPAAVIDNQNNSHQKQKAEAACTQNIGVMSYGISCFHFGEYGLLPDGFGYELYIEGPREFRQCLFRIMENVSCTLVKQGNDASDAIFNPRRGGGATTCGVMNLRGMLGEMKGVKKAHVEKLVNDYCDPNGQGTVLLHVQGADQEKLKIPKSVDIEYKSINSKSFKKPWPIQIVCIRVVKKSELVEISKRMNEFRQALATNNAELVAPAHGRLVESRLMLIKKWVEEKSYHVSFAEYCTAHKRD